MKNSLEGHLEANYPEVKTHTRIVEEIPDGYRVTYLPKLTRKEKFRIGVTALTLAYMVIAPVACTMSRSTTAGSLPSHTENSSK